MLGLVSFLTGNAYLHISQMQKTLGDATNSPGFKTFDPHITYLLGESTQRVDDLIEILSVRAMNTAPFDILASGLALFIDPTAVLYQPVARNQALASLHRQLFRDTLQAGWTPQSHYHPDPWLPHITLLYNAAPVDMVKNALSRLPLQSLNLRARISGFCLLDGVEPGHAEITHEFSFQGQNKLDQNPFDLSSRPCQPYDRDFVYGLVESALKPCISAFHTWDENLFDQNFAETWEKGMIILSDWKPVGLISFDRSPSDHLYIERLFLIPGVQSRGWGAWLLNYMEAQSEEKPIRLHVWENNPAVQFYLLKGYRIISTHHHKHLMEKRFE